MYKSKSQNNPFVLFWFSLPSGFSCTIVQRSDVKHCNFKETLNKARTARVNMYVNHMTWVNSVNFFCLVDVFHLELLCYRR